jgi:glutathione peroxidase
LTLFKPLFVFIALSSLAFAAEPPKAAPPAKAPKVPKVDIYAFNLPDIKGKLFSFEQFKNKALLIVNVASQSNYTPQYAGLEKLYQKYKAEGLVVLGIPSNDFGNQEPESEAKIAAFVDSTYHVTFPLFSKVAVRGDAITPLFTYLTKEANPKLKGDVHWNFTKFVVDRKGKLIARFNPDVAPDDPDLLMSVEKALKPGEDKPSDDEAKPDLKPTRDDRHQSDRRPRDGA